MDKLQLAHDWAMKHGSTFTHKTVIDAWAYADAMQAEADKRKPFGLPEALREEWQPDWSHAPDDATAWEYLGHGAARWHTTTKGMYRAADLFGYGGTDMLLMERPHGF